MPLVPFLSFCRNARKKEPRSRKAKVTGEQSAVLRSDLSLGQVGKLENQGQSLAFSFSTCQGRGLREKGRGEGRKATGL